jgi:glycosyltransferase involved in cell wall biosynthesis
MAVNPRIAIATAGRFHVFDLARELHALGYDVTLYSYVPRRRARQFGIKDEYYVSLLPFAAPALIWDRLAPRASPLMRQSLLYKSLNWAVISLLRPCDVFICMSGIYLEAAQYAKRKFNAKIWLERGSHHILSQDEILAKVPGAERPSALVINRELDGYKVADKIVIPSKHVEDSFRRDPTAFAKLFRNPYGVDVCMFPCQSGRTTNKPFTFLFAGSWSLQKGCDILAKAIQKLENVRLVHVGAVLDSKFPTGDERFIHVKPVSQPELRRFYAQADAFVLASREDGFAMVLSQALASGLPVICTDRTGGPDLAHTTALAARITVVSHDDECALTAAMQLLIDRVQSGDRLPPLSPEDRDQLSWTSYARLYSDELLRHFG